MALVENVGAATSPEEAERLSAVEALGLLDTPNEARFDRITELAALVLDAPIALVSLVDRDRQWFKSRVGLNVTQTSRTVSFCSHAIASHEPGPFVVENSILDVRFATNPLVTGEPGIRFYAGQPICTRSGERVGTLCIIDRYPRTFDESQRAVLAHLASMVEDELERESKQEVEALIRSKDRARQLILDTLTEGLVLQDLAGRIVEWNPAAERVLGLSGDELGGRTSIDPRWGATYADGSPWPGETHPASVTLLTGEPVVAAMMGVHHPDGTQVWLRVNSQPVLDDTGTMSGVLVAFADVTVETEHAQRAAQLEQEMRRRERTGRLSLDALEQGVVFADRSGGIHRINPAAEKIVGYAAAELSALWQSGAWETYEEDGSIIPTEERPIWRAATSGMAVDGEVVGWRHRDGRMVLLRLSCVPNVDGEDGLVIAFTDVTAERRAQRLLDATLETAPVGLAILDGPGIVRCNRTFAAQLGRPADDLVQVDFSSLAHPADRATAERAIYPPHRAQASPTRFEQRLMRADGSEIWVETHLAVIPDPDHPRAIVATFDVTSHRQMILELSRYHHMVQHAMDMVLIINEGGAVQYASPSIERLLGFPQNHRLATGVLDIIHPEDLDRARDILARVGRGTGRIEAEPFVIRAQDFVGNWRHVECVAVNLLADPSVRGIVITARDATQREHASQRLSHLATHDALTDLPNRLQLDALIEGSLSRAASVGTRTAVCFLDLDGFKAVNDTAGHAAGDQLLVAVATQLRQAIRAGDTALRLGGDEFIIILDPIVDPAHAAVVAQRVLSGVLELNNAGSPVIGASIGISLSKPGDHAFDLLARADAALYRSKANAGSTIEVDE